jgi:hypothetical protein
MAGSVLTRAHGMAATSPAMAAETTAESAAASQAAMPARGTCCGHAARDSNRDPAVGTAAA